MQKRMMILAFAIAGSLTVASAQQASTGILSEIKGVREYTGTMIVRVKSLDSAIAKTGSREAAVALRQRAAERLRFNTIRYEADIDWYVVQVPFGLNEASYHRLLNATGEYELIEPNMRVFPTRRPNDSLFGQQWHHQTINSELAWDVTVGNQNLIVAVTDTGCDPTHPDLRNLYVPGYNAVDDRAQSQGGRVNDINGHGTHVAGCAAAEGDNGQGVSGVGWRFRIMPIRVSNDSSGGASYDWLSRGARWAADNGAKVISASYSGVDSQIIEQTGQYVRSRGAIYLYAAGNEGRNLSGFDHPNVVVVGATQIGDGRPSWSNFGRGVDIFAPGVDIVATYNGGSYGPLSGTSMATPVANGVFAMVLSINPRLTPVLAESIVNRTARDLGASGNDDTWGWGRVDVNAAVRRAIASIPSPATP